MGGENSYIKGMEEYLKLAAKKVEAAKVKAPVLKAEQKLDEVNAKFNLLGQEEDENFDVQRLAFEKALNELSQLLQDNSSLDSTID